ncbi:MAG: hypothetical protein R3C56_33165 [Pirellulaceae bacterium]
MKNAILRGDNNVIDGEKLYPNTPKAECALNLAQQQHAIDTHAHEALRG